MQRGSAAAFGILDQAPGKPGIGRKQPAQPVDLALPEGRCELDCTLLVASQRAEVCGHHRPVAFATSKIRSTATTQLKLIFTLLNPSQMPQVAIMDTLFGLFRDKTIRPDLGE